MCYVKLYNISFSFEFVGIFSKTDCRKIEIDDEFFLFFLYFVNEREEKREKKRRVCLTPLKQFISFEKEVLFGK